MKCYILEKLDELTTRCIIDPKYIFWQRTHISRFGSVGTLYTLFPLEKIFISWILVFSNSVFVCIQIATSSASIIGQITDLEWTLKSMKIYFLLPTFFVQVPRNKIMWSIHVNQFSFGWKSPDVPLIREIKYLSFLLALQVPFLWYSCKIFSFSKLYIDVRFEGLPCLWPK